MAQFQRSFATDGGGSALERARLLEAESEATPLDPDKTPPPARAFDAEELLDAARATGFAAVGVCSDDGTAAPAFSHATRL